RGCLGFRWVSWGHSVWCPSPHAANSGTTPPLTGAATPTSTKETVMNPARALGHLARILAAVAAAALAVTATTAAALATSRPRPPGWNKHPPVPASPQPTLTYPPRRNQHPPLH